MKITVVLIQHNREILFKSNTYTTAKGAMKGLKGLGYTEEEVKDGAEWKVGDHHYRLKVK